MIRSTSLTLKLSYVCYRFVRLVVDAFLYTFEYIIGKVWRGVAWRGVVVLHLLQELFTSTLP